MSEPLVTITISGPAGSGKTTLVRILEQELDIVGLPLQVADDALGPCKENNLKQCLEGLKRFLKLKDAHILLQTKQTK